VTPPAAPEVARPAASAAGPRAPWIAIFAAGLAARLVFVATTPHRILWPDGREFEAVARSLLEHGTYGLQTLRPPGYPTLIAAVYAVFGENLVALRLVEAVLGALAAVLIGTIGARLFGRRAGLVSGALAAFHPVLAFLPSTQYSENTLVLVVALALGTIIDAWRRGRTWRWLAGGALLGVAILVRPNAVLVLPGLALGLALAMRRARRAWLRPALACAAALALTLSPWVIRNHQVHGRWYFLATGGGRQFWFGNNPRATGDTRIAIEPDSATMAALHALPDDSARERYLYGQGLAFVRAHPGRALGLYVRELGNLFAPYPDTVSQTYINPWSRAAQGLMSAIVFAGALLALARFRHEPALWALAGGVASYALGSAAFLTMMRYRLAIEPCLLWMAGLGWAGAVERWVSPRSGSGSA
jgi:4-amino-4-deoxy-L-arabinose transferase-like glycosyltransferase